MIPSTRPPLAGRTPLAGAARRRPATPARRPSRPAAPAWVAALALLAVPACTSTEIVGIAGGSITVTPGEPILMVGETVVFTAVVRDEDGKVISAPEVTWTSSVPSIVSVTSEGVARGLATGYSEVRATALGVSGTAVAEVRPAPEIVADPPSISFFVEHGTNPSGPAAVEVRNGGSGSLGGLSASVEYAGGQPSGWIGLDLSSTSAPATLAVSASTATLDEGEYAAVVRIASPDAAGGPLEVPVQLSISRDEPIIDVLPAAVGFAAVRGGSDPSPRTVQIRNGGKGSLEGLSAEVRAVDGPGGWLTAILADGNAPTGLRLEARVGDLPAGTYRSEVLVAAPGAVNSPRPIPVSLSVEQEPRADLSVAISGPAEVRVRDTLEVALSVTNGGPREAADVRLADSLPAGLEPVEASDGGTMSGQVATWSLGLLPAGSTAQRTLRVVATSVGDAVHEARVSASTMDPVADNDRSTAVVTVRPRDADLSVAKDGPDEVPLGARAVYRITTTNEGPGPAEGVVVLDSLPEGVTVLSASAGATVAGLAVRWSGHTLDAGESRVDSVTVRLDGTGAFTDVARVSATTPDPEASNDRAPLTTRVAPVADVSVVKTGPSSAGVGDTLVYTVTVSNAGPDAAEGVEVVDSLPDGTAFVSATGGPAREGDVLVWSTGGIAPEGSRTDSVRVVATGVGAVVNVVRASTSTIDPDGGDRRSSVTTEVAGADLSVAKAGPPEVEADQILAWTITVRNDGPAPALDVTVVDSLPEGVAVVSPDGAAVTDGTLTWSLGTLEPGDTVSRTVEAEAAGPGDLVNVVRASSSTPDPDADDLRAETTTRVTALPTADLSVTAEGPAEADLGDVVTYEFVVRNDGPAPALDVTVVDSLPPDVVLLSADGGSVDGRKVTWIHGMLDPGETLRRSVQVRLMGDADRANVVRVASSTADPDAADLRAETFTAVHGPESGADLSVQLTGPSTAAEGDTLTYVVHFTNAGPDDALWAEVDMTISDDDVDIVYVSSGADVDDDEVRWRRFSVPAGAYHVDTVRIVPDDEGSLTVRVRASSLKDDWDEDDTEDEVTTEVTGGAPMAAAPAHLHRGAPRREAGPRIAWRYLTGDRKITPPSAFPGVDHRRTWP